MPSATEVRRDLAEIVNRAAYGKERVAIERRGKAIAYIVSAEDMQRLDDLEDAALAELAARRLAEDDGTRTSSADLKAELGL